MGKHGAANLQGQLSLVGHVARDFGFPLCPGDTEGN